MKTKLGCSIPRCFVFNGKTLTNNFDICHAFSQNFKLNFVAPDKNNNLDLSPPSPSLPGSVLNSLNFNPVDVLLSLKCIRPDASSGPDGIPSMVLTK